MTLLFEIILITSLLVIGWTIITQPAMGFGGLREWADEYNSVLINATLFCHWCMPSSWSLLGYFFAWRLELIESFSWKLFWMYPLVVCGSSFLCGVSWAIFKRIEIHIKQLSNVEKLTHWDIKDRSADFQKNKN